VEIPAAADDPQTLANYIAAAYVNDGPTGARLGAIYRKYSELRGKLRLVAHVAKRFRDRGIPYTDLLQEGFCGLLEAIDRFDLNHQTKLATYATWWIRQSMQRAVASGAYPVRLTPRHLRQLAQNQEELERQERARDHAGPNERCGPTTSELIHRIHTATRPTISLDAAFDQDSSCEQWHPEREPDLPGRKRDQAGPE
jgi:RNA polymerase primary sigma factor